MIRKPILIFIMDPNFLCPICKKDNCFVCKYWNDNELMDLLLSENGALVFDLNCIDIV